MAFSATLRCFAGCPGSFPVTRPIYRCPTCGGLLDVKHDEGALRERTPAAWKSLFEERWRRAPFPMGSGVWGKREWVMPELADDDIVSTDEGGTTLYPARRYAEGIGAGEVLVKQCGATHTGSFKDLGMTVLVSVVKR